MHAAAYDAMDKMVERFLGEERQRPLKVLEVGSHGSGYRPLVKPPWEFFGLDLKGGDDVHIVVEDPHRWTEVEGSSFDVVVSGSCLEHTQFVWEVVSEIARVLRAAGTAILIAPSIGGEHRYPTDCWRILPDGMLALCKWSGLEPIEIGCSQDPTWWDTVLVARKPS